MPDRNKRNRDRRPRTQNAPFAHKRSQLTMRQPDESTELTATSAATSRGWRVPLAIGAVLLGLLLGVLMINISVSAVSAGVSQVQLAAALPAAHDPGSRSVGRVDAPVQILVYSDFQCTHCEALHREVEGELIRRYVATGKARLTMRQYPILGPESTRAAEASLAAAEQGRFWEYRDALFRAFDTAGKAAYSDEGLIKVAEKVGLDVRTFSASLASGKHSAEVESEKAEAKALGFDGVPVIVINGERVPPQNDMLKASSQAMEEVLAK